MIERSGLSMSTGVGGGGIGRGTAMRTTIFGGLAWGMMWWRMGWYGEVGKCFGDEVDRLWAVVAFLNGHKRTSGDIFVLCRVRSM